MAARIPLPTEDRWCEFCDKTGRKSLMQHHKPLRDHYYCTTCGSVEIDWPAIYPRVESLLYEYRCAKSRLNMLPAVKAIQYDVPYVDVRIDFDGNKLDQWSSVEEDDMRTEGYVWRNTI